MEETVIVIMIKEKETGFLEKELGCYSLEGYEELVYNTYAEELEDGSYRIFMKLTCGRDVSDWEYEAIYDYYDTEVLRPYVLDIEQDEEQYNPTWIVSFDYSHNTEEMETKINQILSVHKVEMDSVFEAIADKKDDYIAGE